MNLNYLFFLIYLFTYCQLCPAIEFTVAKELQANNTGLVEVEEHGREKRGIFAFVIAVAAGIISRTVARIIGEQISNLINGQRLRREAGRVGLINQRLNLNYNNALALKRKITTLNPYVGNSMLVSAQGFQCDASFCAGKTSGHYAMGLCTKHMCYCSPGNSGPLECGGGLVFNPVGRNCDYPTNMALCGY